MDTESITLSFSKELLLEVRRLAAGRQMSVSALLAQTLEEMGAAA